MAWSTRLHYVSGGSTHPKPHLAKFLSDDDQPPEIDGVLKPVLLSYVNGCGSKNSLALLFHTSIPVRLRDSLFHRASRSFAAAK